MLDHLCQALGAGIVIGPGHADFTACRFDRFGYCRVIGRDNDAAGARLACTFHNMHHHRLTVDIGQRFTR
ncbi:hypothetical protein D3C73_1566260 [compost metagenome]